VATVTEIYDFLRVLFARIGTMHCLKCGQPVQRDTIDSIVDTLYKNPPQTKILIAFSWPLKKGVRALQKDGFFRVIKDDKILNLDEVKLDKDKEVDVLVDRMSLSGGDRERLVDSLETGLKRGEGKVKVRIQRKKTLLFSERL
jgi:excinuclease ABC subunit A